MARRAYRMTPARRRALRKAQIASARKRRKTTTKVKSHIKRHKKKYVAGGAIVAAGATTAYGTHRYNNVYLYHNTNIKNASSIKKNGLKGVRPGSFSQLYFNEPIGHVFVSKDYNSRLARGFGNSVVRVKMNRKEFNKYAIRDKNMKRTSNAFSIHERHLQGRKVKVRRAGPIQSRRYKSMFPDGTKESWLAKKQAQSQAQANRRRKRRR